MADFYQTGRVTTLHRLRPGGLQRLERDLEQFTETLPIGLVLPALYSEFETPSMKGTIEELAKVRYLKQIVMALGWTSFVEYQQARSFFESSPVAVTFLWIDGERLQELFALLDENGLSAGMDGKGRSRWMFYGYLLAMGECVLANIHTPTL